MTVGAFLLFDGIPIVFSDLLVTQDGYTGFEAGIPVHPQINRRLPLNTGFEVVGLRQKLIVINEQLTVIFAGSAQQAEEIFQILQAASRAPQLDADQLQSILSAIEPASYSDLQSVVILTSPTELGVNSPIIQVFGLNAEPIIADRTEQCLAIGSGCEEFAELLRGAVSQIPLDHSSLQKSVAGAKFLALQLAGGQMGHEYWDSGNLLNRWGGGFEAAMFRNGSFQKLDRITHLFWRVFRDENSEPQIEQKMKVLKQEYQSDFLVFRNIEVMTEDDPAEAAFAIRSML